MCSLVAPAALIALGPATLIALVLVSAALVSAALARPFKITFQASA